MGVSGMSPERMPLWRVSREPHEGEEGHRLAHRGRLEGACTPWQNGGVLGGEGGPCSLGLSLPN